MGYRCLVCCCRVVRHGCSWVSSAVLQLTIVTKGDREKTVSDSILTSPNLSLSPPDKRAGLLAMMSSARIWKVRVS